MTTPDIVVVGGGVAGTMHAWAAWREGLSVVQIERDAAPRGASVRNLGLIWLSGRAPGAELHLADRARALWDEVAETAPGVALRPLGSITVARDGAQLALMAESADQPDAGLRDLVLLDRAAVRACNPALTAQVAGGLLCRRDAVVEPRAVLGALRAVLEPSGRYRFVAGRRVTGVGPGWAEDHTGSRYTGALVIVCPGAELTGLGPPVGSVLDGAPLRRCRLQMLETAPWGGTLATAVADGDSMRYYPSFDLPARSALDPPDAATRRWGMQLLMVQRADGGLTIGDTHEYEEPFDFAVVDDAERALRARAEDLVGPLPPTRRRWSGVYAVPTDAATHHQSQPEDGVVVVTGLGGRGMTLSPAVAEATIERTVGLRSAR